MVLATQKRFGGACPECCWDLEDGHRDGVCRYCSEPGDSPESVDDASQAETEPGRTYCPPDDAPNERELVLRAKEMDEAALAALFKSYYPRVYAYGLVQLRDVPAAEDFASDVILRMMDGIGRYEFRDRPFSAWIFRIARNRLIDLQRQRKRLGESPLDEGKDYREVNGGNGTISQLLDVETIQEGLSHLTASQAQVIVLRFLQDLDLPTVARILGRSDRAIKSLQFRAVSSLRKVIAGMDDASEIVAGRRTRESAPATAV
ncbi:MAG TPA: sigma-70 family RNA polymerase sigma factor [Dehalococcoidia bacterium]|nr:sigma-70 family RNA polymerase sigma factor [Dehalococcoidia bacterium]